MARTRNSTKSAENSQANTRNGKMEAAMSILPTIVKEFERKTHSKTALMEVLAAALNNSLKSSGYSGHGLLTAKDATTLHTEYKGDAKEQSIKSLIKRRASPHKRSPAGKNPESNRRLNAKRRDLILQILSKLKDFKRTDDVATTTAEDNHSDDDFNLSPSKSTRSSKRAAAAAAKKGKAKAISKKGAATLKASQAKHLTAMRKRIFDELAMEQIHNQMEPAGEGRGFRSLNDYSQKLVAKEVAALKQYVFLER